MLPASTALDEIALRNSGALDREYDTGDQNPPEMGVWDARAGC